LGLKGGADRRKGVNRLRPTPFLFTQAMRNQAPHSPLQFTLFLPQRTLVPLPTGAVVFVHKKHFDLFHLVCQYSPACTHVAVYSLAVKSHGSETDVYMQQYEGLVHQNL
jgi:hypothetical protein